jgi:endonuclease-3 related protein
MMYKVFQRLRDAFGPQHWWPGDGPFETMVGAVLTQNTSWKNVERAIANLRDAGLLSPRAIHETPVEELAELIRSAGYYRVKARRVQNLVRFLFDHYGGSLEAMLATGKDTLREQLLSINGIGPETADSMVLYAANLPTFVVDTYTARVLKRHGWIEPEADYDTIKDYFENELTEEVSLYNEFHALLVRVGNLHCRKDPRCDACPLFDLLPPGGPLDLSDGSGL